MIASLWKPTQMLLEWMVLKLLMSTFFSHLHSKESSIHVLLFIGFLMLVISRSRRMGMWTVEPDVMDDGAPLAAVIHLDTIIQAAHLLPVFKKEFVPRDLSFSDTLDKFQLFYVINSLTIMLLRLLPSYYLQYI